MDKQDQQEQEDQEQDQQQEDQEILSLIKKEYYRNYYQENKERINKKHSEYVANHKEKVRQYNLKYYHKNKKIIGKTKAKQKRVNDNLDKLKLKAEQFKASLIS